MFHRCDKYTTLTMTFFSVDFYAVYNPAYYLILFILILMCFFNKALITFAAHFF